MVEKGAGAYTDGMTSCLVGSALSERLGHYTTHIAVSDGAAVVFVVSNSRCSSFFVTMTMCFNAR